MKSKNFGSGTQYLRQCHFAMTDLELHARCAPGEGADAVFAAERASPRRRAHAGDRRGPLPVRVRAHLRRRVLRGYYSYLWAEVLSADAFGAFEEAGALEDDATLSAAGAEFAGTVLAMGGGAAPMEVFKAFADASPPSRRCSGTTGSSPPKWRDASCVTISITYAVWRFVHRVI